MAIPKIIHYCWFGSAPKPKSVLRCIDSWKKYCPDFEIREWTEKDFDVTQNEYTHQAYEAKAWGFVPDYIRLWIIYNYGGVYLDTDVQIIKSLTPLLENKAYAGFEDREYVNFGQGFGAEKGNPVILDHMKMYDTLYFVNEDGTLNKTASPQYTTRCLKNYGLKEDSGVVQSLSEFTVFPKEYFCPKNFHTGLTKITPDTYSIHQFDASWYDEKQQEEKCRRWKDEKRKARICFWRYLPNRVLLKLVGNHRYEKLKKLFGKG